MPIFHYKGYNADGTETKGSLEASGLKNAINRVRTKGIFPTDMSEAQKKSQWRILQMTNETFLPNMTRQLSILLSSGVPMMDALQSLSTEYSGYYRDILIEVKERVSGGASLYRALEDYGPIFPEFYTNMVHAGEASGALEGVLVKLADFLENQSAIRSKVRSAMIYPILMMGVSIVVFSFLFTFVIPKIVKIFADTKSSLPLITVILVFISDVFTKYWWALIILVAAAVGFVRRFLKTHMADVDRFLLKLPGNVLQSLYYSRFARTMGFLLDGGLPMLRSLKLSAKSIGNRELEASVSEAGEKVAEGQPLSQSLRGFPPVFIQLVSTGEKTGRLAETLNRAASSYEEEFNRKMANTVSLFEPVMILLMGIVVCFIVLAVLLPIFQLNQLVK
jgi:general secretion pathway protein F